MLLSPFSSMGACPAPMSIFICNAGRFMGGRNNGAVSVVPLVMSVSTNDVWACARLDPIAAGIGINLTENFFNTSDFSLSDGLHAPVF